MKSLKEWAIVVKALENGDQSVILRKGGILETSSGFNMESKKFLLFPTFEHQELSHIKPQFQDYLKNVKENIPKEGYNKLSSYAEVIEDVEVSSVDKINELTPFHIWSDSYIVERINWMPEKPMRAALLRVYKIPEFDIPLKPEYEGCKSWIDIKANTETGTSVLSDSELDSKVKKFREIVN